MGVTFMFNTHNELTHHHKLQLLLRFALSEGWQVKSNGRNLELIKPGLPPIYTSPRRTLLIPSTFSVMHAGDSAHD